MTPISSVLSISISLAPTRVDSLGLDAHSESTASTPRLSPTSSVSSHSGGASSASSASPQTPDVDVFGSVIQLVASSIIEAASEYQEKPEATFTAGSKPLNDARAVAWWKF
jgi:hypothetical protein